MNADKVSIIIPVYNGEKYIKQCVETLQNQIYENWEAIFINDGSKDNTPELLKEFMNREERVRIIDQENMGVAVARKNGVEAANGKYITFLDVDDTLDRKFLKDMVCEMTVNGSDICVCAYNIIIEILHLTKKQRRLLRIA